MKVLIIEDEKHTALHLQDILFQCNPEIEVVAILSSVSSSVEWFAENNTPDLIFQDIELSDGQCFEIYGKSKIETPIIFTTAYSEHALKAFDLNSIAYIIKPYDIVDIERVLNKFMKFRHLFQPPTPELLQTFIQQNNPIRKKRFLIRLGNNYKSISSDDVAYILSEDGISFVTTHAGNRFPVDQTLNEITKDLDSGEFFRINRNYIIKHESIKKISSWFNSRLKVALSPSTKEDVVVSRDRVKEFKTWLGA